MFFRSLRARLTGTYAGFLTLGLVVLAIAAQFTIERAARRSAVAELAASGKVYDRLWAEREATLAGMADVVARDFGFRSAVASGDTATIGSALASLRARAGVPIAVLMDATGHIVGDAGDIGPDVSRAASLLADQRDAVLVAHGRPYRIVTAPIMTPFEIGRIVFAVPLDPHEMRSLEQLSAIPLEARVLVRTSRGRWSASGITLPASFPAQAVTSLRVGGASSFASLHPLRGATSTPEAALLLAYPATRALAPYRTLQIGLALVGVLWLVAAVFGSGRIARGITRPIALLDRAARRLEQGERVELRIETQDEVGRLSQTFNAMSRGIVEREERISHLALHDPLTDLPNRAFFRGALEQEIGRAQRSGDTLGLLYLDLDSFKSINDTLGHPVGDALLRRVGERLGELAGAALVSRLGGDEFAIVVTEPVDQGRSRRLADAIQQAFAEPLDIDGHLVATGASIGIALFPEDAQTREALVKNADLALYRAKQDGRGVYRFFEQSLDDAARRRRQIEAELRVAIRTGALDLAFQPIVGSSDEEIRGFEALLRWTHPALGSVSPAEFIPVAEETGLIVPLGEWVLHEATRVASTWPSHIRIAVNVSPLQFRAAGFQAIVVQALARSGLAPQRLEIEITESVFVDGEEVVVGILHALRAIGVRIALDDFGTGYSSLSYLRSFPFDKLKIDRSFVMSIARDASAAAIVKAILDLAKALSMETTAEGVESEDQLAELQSRGCNTIQGYLFSRPVDMSTAATLALRRRISDVETLAA